MATNIYFKENEYMDYPSILVCNLDPVKEELKRMFLEETQTNDLKPIPFADLNINDLFGILHYALVLKKGIAAVKSKYLKDRLEVKCYYKYHEVDCSSITSLHWSIGRGNCMNVDLRGREFRVIDKGTFEGITIKINLASKGNFTSHPGVDILIQERGIMFFPGYEGESLSPGYSYNIGLKKKIIKRIDRLHNNSCMKDDWIAKSLHPYLPNVSRIKASPRFCRLTEMFKEHMKMCKCSVVAPTY